ncbi:hypothetical protein [Prevotella sp. 10(H)]|uniref:hypothetical protein n=1 Tax=Prevotella sp. 10(H) TaxID=1158294 RepID=UPI0004A72A2B|nr:hypothetical protein [Prevotella sp. 10(H)]
MKKTTLFCLLFPVLFVFIYSSCSDDDNEIRFYQTIDGGEISDTKFNVHIGTYYLRLVGGKGNYSAKSSDQEILVVDAEELQNNYLKFDTKKEGTANIVVTDSEGNSATVYITVSKLYQVLAVKEILSAVDVEDAELKKQLEEEIIRTSPVKPKAEYLMMYDNPYEGKLVFMADEEGKEKYEGTFSLPKGEDKMFRFNYNNKVHEYYLPSIASASEKSTPPPPPGFYLMEDLTKENKEKYPDKGIKRATRMQRVQFETVYY